jgi:DNA-binding winged helix-turn-helix (wHTH) protein
MEGGIQSFAELAASHHARERLRFGEFELDLAAYELRQGGRLLAVADRSLQVLGHLIQHRDRTVLREELLDTVWAGLRVGAGSLNQAIWELRRTLGTNDGRPMIKTFRGLGYRFIGQVLAHDPARSVGAASRTTLEQQIGLLSEDDLRAVVAFVETLRRGGATPPSVGGERLGAARFG